MEAGFFKNKKGLLFVVSGPAGSGKGTIMKMLMESGNDYALSVSATGGSQLQTQPAGSLQNSSAFRNGNLLFLIQKSHSWHISASFLPNNTQAV